MQPLQGILFAIDAGISRLKIETDASNSNSTHTSSSFDMVVNVVIFHDIKCLLYAESVYVKVVNSTRSCNLVADTLAKLGACLGPGAVELWPDCNPAAVNDLVATDQVLASV